MLFGFFKNFLIVILLIGALVVVTHFSPNFKKQVDTQFAKVLGVKTEKNADEKPLADSLKKDAKDQAKAVKDQAMHTDLSEIMQTVNRLQKIPRDAQATLEEATKFVGSLIRQKN